ncbi:MAG TPA: DUF2079 domain-containing protein [Fimbriimonadaceae bacterium]
MKKSIQGYSDNLARFCILLFGAVYAFLAVYRHDHFLTGGYDLGIFTQAIWHYSHFQIGASSIKGVSNLLSDHFHPALVLFVPFFWLYPHAETLLVLQAFLLCLSAWPLYLLLKKVTRNPVILISLLISYLAFWGIRSAALYDFHEVALAVPLVAWLLYFTEEKRWRLAFVAVLLLLLVREDMALVVIMYGVYLLLKKNWNLGVFSVVFGGLYFVTVFHFVIPALSGGTAYSHWNYPALGATPRAAISNLIHHPAAAWNLFFDSLQKQQTLLYTMAPFLFLCVASPSFLLALPLLAERFYSSQPAYVQPSFQYTAYLAPILLFGLVQCLSCLIPIADRIGKQRLFGAFLLWFVALGAFGLALFYWQLLPYNPQSSPVFVSTEEAAVGEKALALIPTTATVAAQDHLLVHLSTRTGAFELYSSINEEGQPGPFKTSFTVDYLVFSDYADPWPAHNVGELTTLRKQLISKNYKEIFAESGWYVLQRRP